MTSPRLSAVNLVDALNDEEQAVAGGTAQVCGADHHGATDGMICMRVSTHAESGEAARESHAYHVVDQTSNYWVTWINQPPPDQPAG